MSRRSNGGRSRGGAAPWSGSWRSALRLCLLSCCVLVVLLALSMGPEAWPETASEVVVDVWYPWGGEAAERLLDTVELFNSRGITDGSGRRIRVEAVFSQSSSAGNQKFFIGVAGGVPPEVVFVDGPQVCEWAHRGALRDLGPFLERTGIEPEDFYAPCWRQNLYEGGVYALTYCADPNFGFFWNKNAFRQAGLPPDVPPRTIEEMDAMAAKLTTADAKGFYTSIGIIPWGVYGEANSLYTWGWAFGGRFYDPAQRRITCDEPRTVKALEWMASYDSRFDKNRIAALRAGFGGAEQNPFILGKLAMHPTVIGQLRELERYAPWLEYGVAPMPYPDSERWGRGEPNSSWVGGWCLALPAGGKRPDAAFRFVHWLCATDEGTEAVARGTGSFPGYRRSRYIHWLQSDAGAREEPARHELLKILELAKHQRPVIPVQAYYMDQLRRAVDRVLYRGLTPAAALRDAREATQEALDKAMARSRRQEGDEG